MSQLLTDELGQTLNIRDNSSPALKGKECILANINTVQAIANFISTSLGPTGMDKILITKDDNMIVTNDGATILKEMDMTENPISQLIVQLSQSQDEEVGDGTTSIVILAAAFLQQSKKLIERGIHPIKIAEGFSKAAELSEEHLKTISEQITDIKAYMKKAAKTSLGSKIVSTADFSDICVEAVLSTADMERKDVDLDLINIQSKVGKNLSDTKLIKGIVLMKEFSHPQMVKEIKNARVAMLSCPFEPPKLKNKNSLLIKSAEEYENLANYEKLKFKEMIDSIKNAKADVVICQWGFDDEANSLLKQNGIPAVRWVGGHELGLMASHINGSIIARFEDLRENHLGTANVREESLGTDEDKIIVVENPNVSKGVTILVRGSTNYVIEEAKRSIRDALCAVRNILTNSSVVYGGGSCEISTSIFLRKKASSFSAENEEAIKSFADGLLEIPLVLAKNCGLEPIGYVEKLIEQHALGSDNTLGVDCFECGEKSMKKLGVFEALDSKVRQIKMAAELVNMILKIHEVIPTAN